MSGYQWIPCHNFGLPPNAVHCGKDLDGSDLYVGLCYYNGDELPCKIIPQRRQAYVSYNGQEIQIHEFKILCQKTMMWIPDRYGCVPDGAVPAGRTMHGEILYVGRTRIDDATVVGKVHPSHKCLYFPFDGKEVARKEYEVLVLQ